MSFTVIDNKTGKEPDCEKIALTEDWAKHLIYCDIDTFAITEDGGIFCEVCGNDLSVDGAVRFTMHLDGTDFFENRFICTTCGTVIIQRHKRSKEDTEWWW